MHDPTIVLGRAFTKIAKCLCQKFTNNLCSCYTVYFLSFQAMVLLLTTHDMESTKPFNFEDKMVPTSNNSTTLSIHTLTQCLNNLHQLEQILQDSTNDQIDLKTVKEENMNMLRNTYELVKRLKMNHMQEMPNSVKDKISVEPFEPCSYEIVYLLGRCFNLSMNSKILQQCHYADPTMAEKLLIDFYIIETVLKHRLHRGSPTLQNEEISLPMKQLSI